tara:strand:+ start:1227 stop:3968 length:2742 start_codon:yes stop_codon:yes gene_type:complete
MQALYRTLFFSVLTALLSLNVSLSFAKETRSDALWALSDDMSNFDAVLWTTPAHPRAEEETVIDVSIRYGLGYGGNTTPGDPVQNLQTLYGRTIELFVVSENLDHFARLRPEQFSVVPVYAKETAMFQLRHRFPWGGRYRLVVTFAHRGKVHQTQFDLHIDGSPMQISASRDLTRQKSFDRYSVSLHVEPEDPMAGSEVEFRYEIYTNKNEPVVDLEAFEGTEMRVAYVRNDLKFFAVEDPRLTEDSRAIPIVPRLVTKRLYGRGLLKEILPDGRMLIEHGPIKNLISIAAKMPFRIADVDALRKVHPGDWVEFWLKNDRTSGLVVTRIEPLSSLGLGEDQDAIRPSSDNPLFPGPVVPVRHTFPSAGLYVAFGQFKHQGILVTTRFMVNVSDFSVADAEEESTRHSETINVQRVLTPQERNGMMIYTSSTSLSKESINLGIGDGQLFPANRVTCANCHGHDGKGSREGGAVASDIRHAILSKPYSTTTESGRTRSPYTNDLLKRAIVEGVDSNGHVLDFAMPRWKMSEQDLEDLIVYLQRLGTLEAPGVTETTIKIGTILDLSGPFARTGETVLRVMENVFKIVNAGKKVYGRSIELVVADGKNDPRLSLVAAKRLIEKDRVLGLVGTLGDAANRLVIPYLDERGIPLVAPLAPALQPAEFAADQLFSIYPSLDYQARVLIDYGMGQNPASFAVLYSDDSFGKAGLTAVRDQLSLYHVKPVAEVAHVFGRLDVEKTAKIFRDSDADFVVLLTGDPSVIDLIAAADRLSYSPLYLGHNLLVTGRMLEVPRAGERVVLAQNFRSGKVHHPLVEEFSHILKSLPASGRDRVLQISAFVAAKVLLDGLRNAGNDLTRASLVTGLEKVNLDTGLLGTIRYSQQNHEGSFGISLVKPDGLQKTFAIVSDRREPVTHGH